MLCRRRRQKAPRGKSGSPGEMTQSALGKRESDRKERERDREASVGSSSSSSVTLSACSDGESNPPSPRKRSNPPFSADSPEYCIVLGVISQVTSDWGKSLVLRCDKSLPSL